MKYSIDDLRDGKCAAINDGTLEELREVLRLAFPNSSYLGGGRGLLKTCPNSYIVTTF